MATKINPDWVNAALEETFIGEDGKPYNGQLPYAARRFKNWRDAQEGKTIPQYIEAS